MQNRYFDHLLKKALAAIFLFFIFFELSVNYSLAVTVDRIIASANNEIITLSDYKKYVSKIDNIEDQEKVDENILKSLIEEKLILQEARKIGLNVADEDLEQSIVDFQKQNNLSKDDFLKKLSEEQISLKDYKKLLKVTIISAKLIEKEVNSKVFVTDEDIANYYNKNKDTFLQSTEKMQIKAIFLKLGNNPSLTEVTDLKIRSLKIRSEIKNSESFDKMAALYSDEPLKSRNGMLGEFGKGELIPAFEKGILALKEGEISDPVWTKEGVYILCLSKEVNESFTPIEKIKESIYSILLQHKKKEKFNEWMKKLWGNSTIKIKQL